MSAHCWGWYDQTSPTTGSTKHETAWVAKVFKNVVAQFIGRLCIMNQAITTIWR